LFLPEFTKDTFAAEIFPSKSLSLFVRGCKRRQTNKLNILFVNDIVNIKFDVRNIII